MTIIHVDTNKYTRIEMHEQVSAIEPKAELYSFERPESALEFVQKQGCDALLTEIEFWSEKYGGIRLAKAMKEINLDVKLIFVTVGTRTRPSAIRMKSNTAVFSRSLGRKRNLRRHLIRQRIESLHNSFVNGSAVSRYNKEVIIRKT